MKIKKTYTHLNSLNIGEFFDVYKQVWYSIDISIFYTHIYERNTIK